MEVRERAVSRENATVGSHNHTTTAEPKEGLSGVAAISS
jgi:hypothetical protein